MGERLEPIVAWALGAFHAAVLMLLFTLALHVLGSLGGVLGRLSTVLGLGAYLVLWAATGAVAWWVTRGVAWTDHGPAEPAVVLNRALLAGGVLGAAALGATVLVLVLPFALQQGIAAVAGALAFAAFGGLFAFVGGALVGGLLAGLDLALLRVAGWVLQGPTHREAPHPR